MTQTTAYSSKPSRVTNKMVIEDVCAMLVRNKMRYPETGHITYSYFMFKIAAGCNPHNYGSAYLPPKRIDAIFDAIEAKMS